MRLEETQQGREQVRLTDPLSQHVGPDSGQVDEPMRPARVTKRCRKRGEGKSLGVIVD